MDNSLKELANKSKEEFDRNSNQLLEEAKAMDASINMNESENEKEEEEFIIAAPIKEKNEITSEKEINLNIETQIDERKVYIKDLITKYGMSIDEAETAATKKFDNPEKEKVNTTENTQNSADSSDNMENKSSNTVIIKIPENNVNKIEFSEDEKEKLQKADTIRLVEVKDEKLKSIKFGKFKRKDKLNIIRDLDHSISRYSSPMPALGEFLTFKGAQTITLLTNVVNDKDTLSDALNKKAALLYDKLIGGTTFSKTDEEGNIVMTFNDFANKFRYDDVDMGLYTIFVASSREEIEIDLGCKSCNKNFKHEYNIKSLLKGEAFPDKYKEKMNDIILNHSNLNYIQKIVDDSTNTNRFMSNYTENIYDVSSPSLSKAMRIFQYVDESDQIMVYNAHLLLYIDMIAIKKDDEYITFGFDEEIEKELEMNPDKYPDYDPIGELFDIIQELPQYEIDIIAKKISEYHFDTEFELKSKCTHCGKTLTNTLSITDMVFLTAQGSTVQTE